MNPTPHSYLWYHKRLEDRLTKEIDGFDINPSSRDQEILVTCALEMANIVTELRENA